MDISNLGAAKSQKFKLALSSTNEFKIGRFLKIDFTKDVTKFTIIQFGPNTSAQAYPIFCKTDSFTSQYLLECIQSEKSGTQRFFFVIENVYKNSLEVQSYSFSTITEYRTSIEIQVNEELIDKIQGFENKYVWKGYGEPSIFVLNNKTNKKQSAEIAFVSGRSLLFAKNIGQTFVAYKERELKNRALPIEFVIAPEIKFVRRSESTNNEFINNMNRISSGTSYINRWEAYSELTKKSLELDCEEFGSINY